MWTSCRWNALAVLLCVLSLTARARAEPLVRVRAESRIELGVTHQEGGVVVTGALRDELGLALAGRSLAIEASALEGTRPPFRSQLTTDVGGRFTLDLPDSEHDYRLLATFAGDATHRGVRVERRVERTRADVRLELRLPHESSLDLDAPDLFVEALAESDAGGGDLAMRLTDEQGRPIASGVTGPDGHLLLRIPQDADLEPGPGLLRLESARDDRRAEAQTEARIVRRRAVFVTLQGAAPEVEAGREIAVHGRVATRAKPRAEVPVGLYVGARHLETVLTNADGYFAATLWINAAPGPLTLTARTDADSAGAYPEATAELTLQVIPTNPVPLLWIVALCAASALLLLIVARSRRGTPVPVDLTASSTESRGPSIRLAPRHGRKDRDQIRGQVTEARSERPVAGASVQVVHEVAEATCKVTADLEGRFASAPLPPGRVELLVQAPGYASAQVHIDIPHRGEWASFEIKLESLRDRALSPFRRIVMRMLPSARAWGIWTNREARSWLGQRSPHQKELLSDLTLQVERACYAELPPSEEDVLAIERAAQALESGLPRDNSRDSS